MKKKKMTIRKIEAEIRKMDPAVTGEQLRVASLLMAAIQVGPTYHALCDYTKYPKKLVAEVIGRARENGIFSSDDRVGGAAWFKKDGGMCFWLDVNCALGLMKKAAS